MYRVGVLVNDNESSHSPFADTVALLRRVANEGIQGPNNYHFLTFDKSNVWELFSPNHHDAIARLDALVIATNATNNVEVLSALRQNRDAIRYFVSRGGGLFVTAQKKLGSDVFPGAETGFLPDPFECRLIRRPEQSSFDGTIKLQEANHRLLTYPNVVTERTIESRCEVNRFTPHRYRSFLEPQHPTIYAELLVDDTTTRRPLLLCSKNPRERVVVSSMALDWAEHEELVQNCLLFVTEGSDQAALLRTSGGPLDTEVDPYVTRARAAKVPLRQYFSDEDDVLSKIVNHSNFILSPDISQDDANTIWGLSLAQRTARLYHLRIDDASGEHYLVQRFRSDGIDPMSLATVTWLTGQFVPGMWGKSVWTYNYVLSAFVRLGVSIEPFGQLVFNELLTHVRTDAQGGVSYDSVTNATAQMFEVLHLLVQQNVVREVPGSLVITELTSSLEKWLDMRQRADAGLSLRDRLYVTGALIRTQGATGVTFDRLSTSYVAARDLLQAYGSAELRQLQTIELAHLLSFISSAIEYKVTDLRSVRKLVERISYELSERQSPVGSWRTMSETAEVTLHLLLATANASGAPVGSSESLLVALDYIYGERDSPSGTWSSDLNATAFSVQCVFLFDQIHEHRGDGFFPDLVENSRRHTESASNLSTFDQEASTLGALTLATESLNSSKNDNAHLAVELRKTRRTRTRFLSISIGLALGIVLSLGTLAAVMVNLHSEHPDVFHDIVEGWREYFVAGFVAVIATTAVAAAYNLIRSVIRERDDTRGT